MEYKNSRSVIAKLALQIKGLSILVLGLLVCNGILGSVLWHEAGRKDVVLVPADLHDKAEITNNFVSSTYLESVALMLVHYRLSVTPETVVGNNDNLLLFVDPAFYSNFKEMLIQEAKMIQDEKIASSFYINHVEVDKQALRVTVSGKLKRWVGERLIGTDQKIYELSFKRSGFEFLLSGFKEMIPAKGTVQ